MPTKRRTVSVGRKRNPQDLTLRNLRALRTDLTELSRHVASTKYTIRALIGWMAQSANTPISHDEAVTLLKMLDARG